MPNSCASLVFGLYVGGDRDEQVPTAQLAGSIHEQKSFSREIPGKEFEESVKSRKAHWRACSFCLEPMLMATLRLDEPDRWSSSGYKMDRDPQVLGFLRNCLLPTKV